MQGDYGGFSFLSSDSSSSGSDDFLGEISGAGGTSSSSGFIGRGGTGLGGVGTAEINGLGAATGSNTLNDFSRPKKRRSPPRTITGARKWLLGERIGTGASSTVRAGIDVTSLQIAAVKVLDMRKLRRTRGALDRIKCEIKILRALNHTNVIALRDVVDDPVRNRKYLVLEMVNGASLQDLIQKEGTGTIGQGNRLPDTQVANFAHQTLIALEYVHGRGYVHRDVKPANLLVTSTGVLKLSDFGVAELLDVYDSEDRVSKTLGSPAFQAPEIASGADEYSGTRVDVWALGVTLFYLLTGNVPFQADSHIGLFREIAKGEYVYPQDKDIVIPEMAKNCIDKMLKVDFKERWSVDQLLKDPWIQLGAEPRTKAEQKTLGWTHVEAKNFNVLELVNRYLEGDSPSVSGAGGGNGFGGLGGNENDGGGNAGGSRGTMDGLFGGMFGSGT